MTIQTKAIEIKQLDAEGSGLARIATLSAVDADGDTYAPGAFGEQHVKVLPAHDTMAVPLGRARLYEEGDEALADFQLNLATTAGKDWHAALKFDFDSGRPLQEWSYGFRVIEADTETRDGERVRVLKKLKVHEISPVVLGAGAGTGTLAMKSRQPFAAQLDAAIEEMRDIVERAKSVGTLRAEQGRKQTLAEARLDQLAALKSELEAVIRAGRAPNAEALRQFAKFQQFQARRHLRSAPSPLSKEFYIARSVNGQYHVNAKVNDVEVTFLVDTGATYVVLTKADAERAGIDVDALTYDVVADTAMGKAQFARSKLRHLSVGPHDLRDIRADVMPEDAFPISLLGMNAINDIPGWRIEGDNLVLGAGGAGRRG